MPPSLDTIRTRVAPEHQVIAWIGTKTPRTTATVQSCSVTLDLTPPDASVVYASGTFSAVLTTPDGGTKNLTDGKFSAQVMNE